jgi:hypothetical protein
VAVVGHHVQRGPAIGILRHSLHIVILLLTNWVQCMSLSLRTVALTLAPASVSLRMKATSLLSCPPDLHNSSFVPAVKLNQESARTWYPSTEGWFEGLVCPPLELVFATRISGESPCKRYAQAQSHQAHASAHERADTT